MVSVEGPSSFKREPYRDAQNHPLLKHPQKPRRRQQATLTEPTRGSLPKFWLVLMVILTACFLVGLLLLFVINSGILGK